MQGYPSWGKQRWAQFEQSKLWSPMWQGWSPWAYRSYEAWPQWKEPRFSKGRGGERGYASAPQSPASRPIAEAGQPSLLRQTSGASSMAGSQRASVGRILGKCGPRKHEKEASVDEIQHGLQNLVREFQRKAVLIVSLEPETEEGLESTPRVDSDEEAVYPKELLLRVWEISEVGKQAQDAAKQRLEGQAIARQAQALHPESRRGGKASWQTWEQSYPAAIGAPRRRKRGVPGRLNPEAPDFIPSFVFEGAFAPLPPELIDPILWQLHAASLGLGVTDEQRLSEMLRAAQATQQPQEKTAEAAAKEPTEAVEAQLPAEARVIETAAEGQTEKSPQAAEKRSEAPESQTPPEAAEPQPQPMPDSVTEQRPTDTAPAKDDSQPSAPAPQKAGVHGETQTDAEPKASPQPQSAAEGVTGGQPQSAAEGGTGGQPQSVAEGGTDGQPQPTAAVDGFETEQPGQVAHTPDQGTGKAAASLPTVPAPPLTIAQLVQLYYPQVSAYWPLLAPMTAPGSLPAVWELEQVERRLEKEAQKKPEDKADTSKPEVKPRSPFEQAMQSVLSATASSSTFPLPPVLLQPVDVTADPWQQMRMLQARRQIEYYFSETNLRYDVFLRSWMDDEGWVSLDEVLQFPRMRRLGLDAASVVASLDGSYVFEVEIAEKPRIRLRNEAERIAFSRISLEIAMLTQTPLGEPTAEGLPRTRSVRGQGKGRSRRWEAKLSRQSL